MRYFVASLTLLAVLSVALPASAEGHSPNNASLKDSVKRAVIWLTRAQEKDGHFKYEYVPYEGVYRKDDNIVRQAGALFALGEIERLDGKMVFNLKNEIERSLAYFEKLSVSGVLGGTSFRCIQEEGTKVCKLGSTALAVVGLMDYLEEYPQSEKQYKRLLRDYIAYIVAMKKDGAGFRYYYYPSRKTQKDDESSFSNGEALFALVRYYERTEDQSVKQLIDGTFAYLNTPEKFDSALYLWAMIALRDLNRVSPSADYSRYAEEYTKWRLADNAQYMDSTRNRCPYIEGLVYAHPIIVDSVLKDRVEGTVNTMLSSTLKMQVGDTHLYRYQSKGGVGGLVRLKDSMRAEGGFLTGQLQDEWTQRIDFTQHCISAYANALVDNRGGALSGK